MAPRVKVFFINNADIVEVGEYRMKMEAYTLSHLLLAYLYIMIHAEYKWIEMCTYVNINSFRQK